MDCTFKHVSQTQLNIVLMKSALVIMPVHSTKILTKTLGELGGGQDQVGVKTGEKTRGQEIECTSAARWGKEV